MLYELHEKIFIQVFFFLHNQFFLALEGCDSVGSRINTSVSANWKKCCRSMRSYAIQEESWMALTWKLLPQIKLKKLTCPEKRRESRKFSFHKIEIGVILFSASLTNEKITLESFGTSKYCDFAKLFPVFLTSPSSKFVPVWVNFVSFALCFIELLHRSNESTNKQGVSFYSRFFFFHRWEDDRIADLALSHKIWKCTRGCFHPDVH